MAVIAELALRGNPEVRFEELYSACQPRVYRTCLAILRNEDDAAEATQEVFSRALPLLTELREPHLWLQTVARNYCLDQLRRQKVRGNGTTLDEDTPGSRRDDPERETMLRDALRQAFQALTPRERRALGRVLLMDDSLSDIAGMLGVSYGAAAQVVSRARRRAAMAARAVIGASFAWLARLALPRERGRASRAAAQVLGSSQNLVLAAAVVFTAGAVAHQSPGPASGALGAAAAAPATITASPAAARAAAAQTGTGASAGAGGATRPVAALTLPAGLPRDNIHSQSAPPPPAHGPVGNQGSPGVLLTVTPTTTSSCAGAAVSASQPNGTPIGSKTIEVCTH